ncbi:MAG: biosynthetic peptidoglycan transglycosylase, partial [Myxococcota bacterium]
VVHRLRPEWADMFRAGRIDGTLSIRRDRPAGNVAAALDVTLHDVDFDHAMVSSTTLEGVDASVAGKLQWEPEEGNIRIRQMRLGLEDVAIIEGDVGVYGIGHGDKRAPVDLQRVRLSLSMKPTEAQAIFDAVPRGLRSELDGMRFRGSVGFTFTADIDAKRIRRMKTTSDITLDRFDIVRYNAHANPRRLLRTFEHSTVQPITDYRYTISEDGPYWTPLNRVSPYVVKAIRTNEDGSFYSHKGFHWGSVRHAIEQNIRNRRYVRGASTVSMQLVKNIFLSTEKTIARKLQEALLTFAMEQAEDIPKNRIMEVYLNVIEWGPHVYGIRAAAWHYFRKRPRALKLDEAVFLISILPGPRKYHAFYERGYIGNGWWNRMQRLMEIMVDRRHITEEEYEKAIEKRPWFRRHGPDTPPVATDSEEEELDVPDDIGLDWPDAFDGEPDHYDE